MQEDQQILVEIFAKIWMDSGYLWQNSTPENVLHWCCFLGILHLDNFVFHEFLLCYLLKTALDPLFNGELYPNQKSACFVLSHYYQHLFQNDASLGKLSKELKNGTEISVGQADFKLQIKIVEILFWSITQELLGQSS